MRALSSYTIAFILCAVFSLSLMTLFTVDHFSVIVDNNIDKIEGMERTTDFASLENRITEINSQADRNNLKVYTKTQAVDLIIMYADYLLSTYNAKAETDYPEDTNNVISLKVSFETSFGSPAEFLSVIGTMIQNRNPIVQINSVGFTLVKNDDAKLNTYWYKLNFNVTLVQPYIAGDVK